MDPLGGLDKYKSIGPSKKFRELHIIIATKWTSEVPCNICGEEKFVFLNTPTEFKVNIPITDEEYWIVGNHRFWTAVDFNYECVEGQHPATGLNPVRSATISTEYDKKGEVVETSTTFEIALAKFIPKFAEYINKGKFTQPPFEAWMGAREQFK